MSVSIWAGMISNIQTGLAYRHTGILASLSQISGTLEPGHECLEPNPKEVE